MRYEITSRQGDRHNITGSDERGNYIFYRGTYDAERDMWRLVPKPGTPEKYAQVLFVPAYMVRWMKPVQAKPEPVKKQKQPADKPKAWWNLPELEGQIEMV